MMFVQTSSGFFGCLLFTRTDQRLVRCFVFQQMLKNCLQKVNEKVINYQEESPGVSHN